VASSWILFFIYQDDAGPIHIKNVSKVADCSRIRNISSWKPV